MDKKEIMKATVELVSAYAYSLSENAAFMGKEYADDYANFIETIYKKVEELTK